MVERILGKAEVDSSILSGGTIKISRLRRQIHLAERNAKRRGSVGEAVEREVSAISSRICDGVGWLERRPASEIDTAFVVSPPSIWRESASVVVPDAVGVGANIFTGGPIDDGDIRALAAHARKERIRGA